MSAARRRFKNLYDSGESGFGLPLTVEQEWVIRASLDQRIIQPEMAALQTPQRDRVGELSLVHF